MSASFTETSANEYVDEIKKLHNSNNQLKKNNQQLYQELETLRDQYREVLEQKKSIENKNKENDKFENTRLLEKILNLENEKNDLSNQLKMAQETINIYKENQNQESGFMSPSPKKNKDLNITKDNNSDSNNLLDNNQNNTESNLQNINDENQAQIAELMEKNYELSQNLNEQIKKNEHFKQNNKILIETFSNYFQKKFKNISQLIQYVKKEGKTISKSTNKNTDQPKTKKVSQKKDENLNGNTPKMEAQKLNIEIEMKKIENEVIKYKHENEIKEIKNKQEIEDKNKKISSLENENNFLKQQIIEMNGALNSIPLSFHLRDSIDQDSKVALLQQALSESTRQLQSSQNENKDISRQLSNVKADNEELFNKIEDKNQEIIKLRIERDDFEGKYNTAFAQLELEKTKNQKHSSSLNDINKKYQMSQDSIHNLEKLFESQKDEILKLTNDRNALSSLVFKIRDIVQKEEDIYQKLISENKSYKKNLKSIRNTINTIKNKSGPELNSSNTIPITSWYCIDFEEDLCKLISEVASNEGINDTSKLKYVFQTIAKYYKRKIDDLQNANKKELDSHSHQTTITNDFIVSVAKQIGVQDVDSDFITNPMKICDFQQNLSSLINECESLRKTNDHHTNLLNVISEKLSSSYEEIPEKIDSTNKQLNDLRNDISTSSSKHKSEKQEYQKKLELINSKNAKSNEQKDHLIAKLKSQNAHLSNQIKLLNEAAATIKATKKNKKARSNKQEEERIDSNQTICSSLTSTTVCESQIVSVDLNNQIKEQKALIQEKDKEIKKLEDEVFFWKQNIEAMKALQNQKEAEKQKNQDNNEEILLAAKKRFQAEKDEISNQYELVITNIKKQNLQLKNIIETMTASISKNEDKMSQIKQRNLQLIQEKEILTNQLKSQKDELNRQVSINSQKMKACQIVTESSSKNTIADLQLQFYEEKRRIFSFAMKLFSTFYNSEKKIDEDVYKDTLTKASEALQKLMKQDDQIRKLLGITSNESVESNVSSILDKLYNQA
ncbi:hypothetical protein M9Y10_016638 [Tritrichomonas musculus]|uniref:GRIP domain-containing protein n=1 Tax=Tritrichomonas musculus TaxID=1915356 RepID=A0ABR2GM24_9EUKA